jgi:hypothetical protein
VGASGLYSGFTKEREALRVAGVEGVIVTRRAGFYASRTPPHS